MGVHGLATCGVVGTSEEEERTANTVYEFYLNTQDAAPCNGTLHTFRFCYYHPTRGSSSFLSTFAIYRRNSQTNSYHAVSQAFNAERNSENIGQDSFTCTTLDLRRPITVQVGDVLGACIFDPPSSDIFQLDIVGSNAGDERYLMTHRHARCGIVDVPSTVESTSLVRESSLVLHIHGNIGKLSNNYVISAMTVVYSYVPVNEITSSQYNIILSPVSKLKSDYLSKH